MSLPAYNQTGVQPGIEHYRAMLVPSMIDATKVPNFFPTAQWGLQSAKYMEYWRWFRGENLENEKGANGAQKFPLKINTVRNFSRKHAAVLLGEDTFDLAQPLVKTLITPKLPFFGEYSEEDKNVAQEFQNIINEVWQASAGRALQVENAIVSQFLGGCVFQLKWEPWRDDLLIPITVSAPTPDFVLPVWSGSDYWRLLEAYILYKIPGSVAQKEYGYQMPSNNPVQFAYYCEHWTEKTYSIFINGEPVTMMWGNKVQKMQDVENPFGCVPLVYIPHLKEGDKYGSSMVDDIRGLVLEYNSRMANTGDIVQNHARRELVGVNMPSTVKRRQLGESGPWAIDLGNENPAYKNPPNVNSIDPPATPVGVMDFPERLWDQMEREANISGIAFGEDEGSQRSALTLAFRMYPSTSHAMMERALWQEGLVRIARMIGRIIKTKKDFLKTERGLNVSLPDDFERRFQVSMDWRPMIPRDREQEVNEVVLLTQSNNMSRRTALRKLGTVRDVNEEWNQILKEAELLAKMQAAGQPDEGAATQTADPVAESFTGGDSK